MTILDAIIDSSKTSFLKNTTITDGERVIVPATTKDGTAINVHNSVLSPVIKKYRSSDCTRLELKEMFNIHKMNTSRFTSTQLLEIVIKLLESKSVYGVTGIIENKRPINLSNPFSVLEDLEQVDTIVVYSYNTTEYEVQDVQRYENFLTYLCKLLAITLNSKYNRKEVHGDSLSITYTTAYATSLMSQVRNDFRITDSSSVILPFTETYESILVPQYFVCSGIHYPFYGMSLIEIKEGQRKGYGITPMLSANISDSGGVCTGSLPSDKFDSLRSLNDSNLASPYRREIFPKDSFYEWVEANKQVAITLLKDKINASTNS